MGRYEKGGRTMVVPDFSVASPNVPQEVWDEIFPGKKEFESKFGKIIKYKLRGNKEYYEYIDDNGNIHEVIFRGTTE